MKREMPRSFGDEQHRVLHRAILEGKWARIFVDKKVARQLYTYTEYLAQMVYFSALLVRPKNEISIGAALALSVPPCRPFATLQDGSHHQW
jgi:hypothetical protein